ncbi:MAG: hypothetical protein FJW20_08960 [Acidimicrobiia bacterium]|nr:hypothetical protein [Acidimicrobiia bacterium]
MLLALLLLTNFADWIPARWTSSDPSSLELVRATPINCLLLEKEHWSPEFLDKAAGLGIATLGVVRPGDALPKAKLTGLMLEGDFSGGGEPAAGELPVIRVGPRAHMDFAGGAPVVGTHQGVWPGINVTEEDAAKAAPTGGPWIDTNAGFLRFARAATKAEIWIANRPPPGTAFPTARYLQAIGDAAIVGARWVVSLDEDFSRRLLAREEKALAGWETIAAHLRFYQNQKPWRGFTPRGQLALVQDSASGGLFSGGILDMIAVKHTPVRAVPSRLLSDEFMEGARMAVSVDPAALTEEQKETLGRFTRSGNTLLSAPAQWKFPPVTADKITLSKEEIETIDAIWKEINSMTGRRNLGARLFNVSTILSSLVGAPAGTPVLLHLVNYSDYPVESITAHVLGKYTKAMLHEPGRAPRSMPVYVVEEGTGTGIDIDKVSTIATLVLE